MHELTIVRSVIDAALKSLPDDHSKIKHITIEAGPMAHVKEGAFEEHFIQASKGTPLEGAKISLKILQPKLLCAACGSSYEYDIMNPSGIKCSKCGGIMQMGALDEVRITGLEFEEK